MPAGAHGRPAVGPRKFDARTARAPVGKLLEASNANDTKAVLATFVEGGVVDDWGREFVGTDAIRGWSDREFIRKHVSLEIRGIEQNGEATAVTANVGGEGPTTLASSSTATASHG
jgi:hypothetical protein